MSDIWPVIPETCKVPKMNLAWFLSDLCSTTPRSTRISVPFKKLCSHSNISWKPCASTSTYGGTSTFFIALAAHRAVSNVITILMAWDMDFSKQDTVFLHSISSNRRWFQQPKIALKSQWRPLLTFFALSQMYGWTPNQHSFLSRGSHAFSNVLPGKVLDLPEHPGSSEILSGVQNSMEDL